jgi:hypothetical protein
MKSRIGGVPNEISWSWCARFSLGSFELTVLIYILLFFFTGRNSRRSYLLQWEYIYSTKMNLKQKRVQLFTELCIFFLRTLLPIIFTNYR